MSDNLTRSPLVDAQCAVQVHLEPGALVPVHQHGDRYTGGGHPGSRGEEGRVETRSVHYYIV